jgi:hypothetical protein
MARYLFSAAVFLLLVGLVGFRIWRYATFTQQAVRMPEPVAEMEEQQLFSTTGGAYLRSDIEANGRLLPLEKYRGFRAEHDYEPKPGDRLCPITRTKAHRDCTWIVGGQTYEFCCPPCIAEFVRKAKDQPEQIQPPEDYVLPR